MCHVCFCAQGIVYGKPASQGITQLKPTRNLRNVAEERVGRRCGGLRVLNSYWVNQVRGGAWRGTLHAIYTWPGLGEREEREREI